jgi:integrase/recombinase XerD
MPTNGRLAELWLDALAAERGSAPLTLESYRFDLAAYFAYLDDDGETVETASRETVVAFLSDSLRSGYAAATVAHRRTVVTGLHRFLRAEGILPDDPTALIESGRRDVSLPFVMRIDEVDALLDTAHRKAADGSETLFRQAGNARRAALLETLYASGMRVTEAVTLRVSAVARHKSGLTIKGKGSKERLVLLNDRAVEAIELWRDLAGQYGSRSDDWVFHSTRDGTKPLTRQAAFQEIKAAALDAGLHEAQKVSPHKLRHAFATHLLSAGVDLRTLQEMLGHADLGSTQIYTHVDTARAEAMVRDLHPLSGSSSG